MSYGHCVEFMKSQFVCFFLSPSKPNYGKSDASICNIKKRFKYHIIVCVCTFFDKTSRFEYIHLTKLILNSARRIMFSVDIYII